jgi:flagellar biosynthesis/type III secretory pathway M-ring protein FliF/YscJ
MRKDARIPMNGLVVLAVLAIYFLLVWVVLPRLGVPT